VSRSESAGGPALSSIIVTPDDYDTIATTVRHLSAQSIAAQIELVIVAPRADRVRVPPNDNASFHSVRIVEIGALESLAAAKAIGVSVAAAPVVAFNEDHSFPEPTWAEALLGAHRGGYTGVAPQMKNANPATALSWAAMFLHFGGTVEPSGGFEADYPAASHNMSYTRAVLRDYGDQLADLMTAEMFLHEALRAGGHRLWVEPSAVTRHANISQLGSALRHAWIGGRLYGGLRRAFGAWPLGRRIVYAGGSPLIPLLRLRRVVPLMRRTAAGRSALPRALPAITLILIVHAMGEAAGYLVGVGSTRESYSDLESHRDRHVRREERALWA
jgi:hypothetical protein